MTDEQSPKKGFLDITQYSDRTRKIIFGVMMGLLLAVVGAAIFLISPANDKRFVAEGTKPSTSPATQAPVDDETVTTPSTGGEADTPESDLSRQTFEETPKDEQEEARLAQQKIIEQSLQREKEQTDAVVEDHHEQIENTEGLKEIASKGILEYCTDHPNETKEQKQARMKPYFHEDNSDYQSPESIFFLQTCSVEGVSEPAHENDESIVIYVGTAWGAQFEENGTANTGYTQYRVIVDNNGIVSFDD